MNYQLIYFKLMERAKTRGVVEGYTERHHIIPKCVGGDDSDANLATLTAREHVLAHLLLVKIYPKSRKIKLAASAMFLNPNGERNVRRTALLREYARQARVGFVYSDESRRKMSESAKKRGTPMIAINAATEARIGRHLSDEHRKSISASMTGKKRGPYKPRTKYKVDPGISRNGE